MKPELQEGQYVYCTVAAKDPLPIPLDSIIGFFREAEAITLIVKRETADIYSMNYTFVAAWITLTVHSSLQAVGLTAAFSKALAEDGISCNVVAGYYHDHLFVDVEDAQKALSALEHLSNKP